MKKIIGLLFFLLFFGSPFGNGFKAFGQFTSLAQVIKYNSSDSLVAKVNNGFGEAKIVNHTYDDVTGEGVITFDRKVLSLADSVFHECSTLVSIILPTQLESIGDYAFFSCSSLKSINIPTSLERIGEGAFYFCKELVSITIPKSVTHIGGGAFFRCNAMTNFKVAPDNPKYDSRHNCNALIESATNKLVYGFASSILPEGITQVGDSAFYFNTVIASVDLPNSITSIGNDAFYNCFRLSSVYIPNNVTNIGDNAFRLCSSLKSIVIGDNVTQIGDHAFEGCLYLQKCYVRPMTPPVLGDSVFSDISANAQLYISCDVMKDYEKDTKWGVYQSAFRDGCITTYHYTTPNNASGVVDPLVARVTYKRRVTPGKWETLYLPFDIERVTVTDEDGEWDLIPWQNEIDGGNYYLAESFPDPAAGLVFDMTQKLESHKAYIIQFPDLNGYYDDKFITFYSTPEWKYLETSYTPIEQDNIMHMEGNPTLSDQEISTPVYMLRGTTNFQLHSSTTLHPFECYVMPNYTYGVTQPRMSIRWRDDVTTSVENSKGYTLDDITYIVEGNSLTVFASGRPINIYAINGTLLYSQSSTTDNVKVNLDKGCYLLQCGDVTKKIML